MINKKIEYMYIYTNILPREKDHHNHVLKALKFQFYGNYKSMKKIISIQYIYDAQTFAKNLFV